MNDFASYRLLGGPGSPYSFKVRAVLRYRRVPHVWLVPPGSFLANEELARADKGILPVLQYPDGSYHADSTPLLLDLERRHPDEARSILPPDPALRFLSRLIEDFGDEWLTYVMFDSRWNDPADVTFCARRQMAGWLGAVGDDVLDGVVERFSTRQRFVRGLVCGSPENRPVYTQTYEELLRVLERLVARSLFAFGTRPSLGDFGLYGPLSQLAMDPTSSLLMRERGARTFAWTLRLDDASGITGSWQDSLEPTEEVLDLLRLIGEVYLPFVAALSEAFASGAERLEYAPWGLPYELALPPKGVGKSHAGLEYKSACLLWLKAERDSIRDEPRARLDRILEQTGCARWLELTPLERDHVPPQTMA